jgi:hypothetical protein
LWLDASDTTTITESGGAVSQWTDKSSNAYAFTQGTAAFQPTYDSAGLNSKPAIKFAADFLQTTVTPSTILSGATGATMFVVQQNDLDPPAVADNTGPSFGFWGTAATSDHFPFTDSNVYTSFARSTRISFNPSPSLTVPRIVVFTSQDSLWRFWLDGGSPIHSTTTATFALNSSLDLRLGLSLQSSFSFFGNLSSILVFNGVLSFTQINQIGFYLSRIWGIPWVAVG